MIILLGVLSFVIIFCVFYFAPRKPKLIYAVKLKRKVLLAHGLQGFYWESKQVLSGDYWFISDELSGKGWVYDCETSFYEGEQ